MKTTLVFFAFHENLWSFFYFFMHKNPNFQQPKIDKLFYTLFFITPFVCRAHVEFVIVLKIKKILENFYVCIIFMHEDCRT